MRTLGEIIELTRDGGRPEYDELRYALCALDALGTFDRQAFLRLANKKTNGEWEWNESFRRTREAFGKSPKDWVGWNNDPDNPEFLQRRAAAKRLADRFLGKPESEKEA